MNYYVHFNLQFESNNACFYKPFKACAAYDALHKRFAATKLGNNF